MVGEVFTRVVSKQEKQAGRMANQRLQKQKELEAVISLREKVEKRKVRSRDERSRDRGGHLKTDNYANIEYFDFDYDAFKEDVDLSQRRMGYSENVSFSNDHDAALIKTLAVLFGLFMICFVIIFLCIFGVIIIRVCADVVRNRQTQERHINGARV